LCDDRFLKLLEEIKALREESNKRFEAFDRRFYELLEEIRRVNRRIDGTIGALGARWGREAMRAEYYTAPEDIPPNT